MKETNAMIKLNASLKSALWGGTKLKEVYGKHTSLPIVAESWELSSHPSGASTIAEGPLASMSFPEYLKKEGPAILGTHGQKFEAFPILIKFIDARDSLSIQVHPNDHYAKLRENSYGKTEMWLVLDCEPGACLYYGVKEPLTPEAFREHIKNNTLTSVLNKVPVKKGDVFFIEAGTIHAIGAGIVICEIQQNSDMTYRVYDYGRKDAAGTLRELHIDKAMDVSRLTPPLESPGPQGPCETLEGGTRQLLRSCPYFTSVNYTCDSRLSLPLTPDSFLSLILLDGEAVITLENQTMHCKKGDSIFIPAQEGMAKIDGCCSFIATTV